MPSIETSTRNIEKKSDIAELLKLTNLIIWDESPMANKFCFEALDKIQKDIISETKNTSNKFFGGKVVVFDGNFRQILPVIPRGNKAHVVHATINGSYIWDHCKVLRLTKHMRLTCRSSSSTPKEIRKFYDWVLQIGDDKISEPNNGYAELSIPNEFLLSDFTDHIEVIVTSTYPNFITNYKDPHYVQCRAILASTIDIVDDINAYVTNLITCTFSQYH